LQLDMGGNLRLIEQDRAFGIDAAGYQRGHHLAGVGGQLGGHMRLADRVEIGEEIQALAAIGLGVILHAHPVADRAQIVAKVEVAGRLDAGDDAHEVWSVVRSLEWAAAASAGRYRRG
jgi:hypothetical protein